MIAGNTCSKPLHGGIGHANFASIVTLVSGMPPVAGGDASGRLAPLDDLGAPLPSPEGPVARQVGRIVQLRA